MAVIENLPSATQERPVGFVLSHAGAAAIEYDGLAPAGFVTTDR